MIELDPVERITTDAIGPPGERVFYLQARGGDRLVTLQLEKSQLELLAASVVSMLARTGLDLEAEAPTEGMQLEEPIDPEWSIGRLALGFDETRAKFFLDAEELVDEEEGPTEPDHFRCWARPEQMVALARHGAAVVARGRPRCELCGNPKDPEGHACPSLNGHRVES